MVLSCGILTGRFPMEQIVKRELCMLKERNRIRQPSHITMQMLTVARELTRLMVCSREMLRMFWFWNVLKRISRATSVVMDAYAVFRVIHSLIFWEHSGFKVAQCSWSHPKIPFSIGLLHIFRCAEGLC